MTERTAVGQPLLRRAASWAVLVTGLVLMLSRLVQIQDAPFILDEPVFLEAARQQLLTGQWAVRSPLRGTQGVTYGPSVVWFYGVVQLAFGSSAVTSILAMCLTVTLGQIYCAFALARRFGLGVAGLGLLLAFMASSAHQLFWSRLAWDQLTDVIPFVVIGLLCTQVIGPWRSLVVGLLLGFGVSSHPMVIPFVVLVVVVLLLELRSDRRRLLTVGGPGVAGFLLVNTPWLLNLDTVGPRTSVRTGEGLSVDRFVEIFRPASFWHINDVMDRDGDALNAWVPLPGGPAPWALGCLAVVIVTTLLAMMLARRAWPGERRLLVLMAGAVLAYPLFFGALQLPSEPHYTFPVGWVPCVGAAALMALAVRGRASVSLDRVLAHSGIVAVTAVQMVFLLSFRGYVEANGGTRGVHYSTTVGQQIAAVRAACESAPATVIRNDTGIFDVALAYHARVEAVCVGRDVSICMDSECQDVPEPFVVRYAGPTGGTISWSR